MDASAHLITGEGNILQFSLKGDSVISCFAIVRQQLDMDATLEIGIRTHCKQYGSLFTDKGMGSILGLYKLGLTKPNANHEGSLIQLIRNLLPFQDGKNWTGSQGARQAIVYCLCVAFKQQKL